MRILSLLKLLNRRPLELCDRIRINVNLDALLVLDRLPGVLELVLHLVPDTHGVGPQLLQLLLGLVLQLPQSVALLDHLGLTHQEVELLEVAVGCVVPPGLLDHDGSHRRTSWTFVLLLWILDNRQYLSLVRDRRD